MTSSTTSPSDRQLMLDIVEVKPGLKFSKAVLRDFLPDVKTALFFGKVYELDYHQLSNLLSAVLNSTVADALLNEGHAHSTELQDYVLDMSTWIPDCEAGEIVFDPDVPTGEVLPELWKSLEIEVADSIKQVAEKLGDVVGHMPGKAGTMVFQSMAQLNARRPTIGDYRARIHHAPQVQNLVILDVSGSMTHGTISEIVDDVVALSYTANAWLAIVSNTCTYWEPGTFDTEKVMEAAEFSGTHYEQLKPLMNMDWGTVVTIADYDSSYEAEFVIARCTGSIEKVIDVSLVNKPTYLARVVGQRAEEIQPIMVAVSSSVLGSNGYW